MCTVVIRFSPADPWPLLIAANRDEQVDRPWDPPRRHWVERPMVTAGRDRLAAGTWLGINDYGLVAGVLNRRGSLGPARGFRSRGEIPLEALDHASAKTAALALGDLDPRAYRPFNAFVADAEAVFWLRSSGDGKGVDVTPVPSGLSMITASDMNDPASDRIGYYLERFRAAPVPRPDEDDWSGWETLLGSRAHAPGAGPEGALYIETERGFGTVSSSLIALPTPGDGKTPIWRFTSERPVPGQYIEISL
jgi:hypothetical protein